jgi:DHA2 family multidrug resistance protein-like MFS transporter
VLGGSLALAAVGLSLLLLVDTTSGLPVLVAASLVISMALSPMFNLTTELIVGSAPPERAGSASGISETGVELGGALGISILGSIGTAIYRGAVANGLPAGIPAEAATVARDTLGGAVAVAQQLPGQMGTALLDVARQAFVQGLHIAAGISGIVAVVAAIVAVMVFRGVSGSAQHAGDQDFEATDATIIQFAKQEAANAA